MDLFVTAREIAALTVKGSRRGAAPAACRGSRCLNTARRCNGLASRKSWSVSRSGGTAPAPWRAASEDERAVGQSSAKDFVLVRQPQLSLLCHFVPRRRESHLRLFPLPHTDLQPSSVGGDAL